MRPITKSELRELVGRGGRGVVLIDRRGWADAKPSTMHAVGCRWASKVSATTPLWYAASFGEALPWLAQNLGVEGTDWRRCGECRMMGTGIGSRASTASRDQAQPAVVEQRPLRTPGEAVWLSDRGRDLGWVADVDSAGVEVAEFDSAARPDANQRRVGRDATSTFRPSEGDRCFIDRGGWRPARCLDDVIDSDTPVRVLADGEVLEVARSQLRFRPLHALASPLATLAEQQAGQITRYRPRAEFLRSYWAMAEASRGLVGLSSAAVDLHAHQVGVARRVLADPVQRYLLADEVGLGKTIEAGFVIRQRLIDAPGSVVVVLVPEALVWQWEAELETKFGIRDLRRGGIDVVSFDSPRAFERIQVPDLVVIDEAHRVAAGWQSGAKEFVERFEAARTLAHRVPRILLLSATPVLHREADLLAMLHLLDPDTYRLEDLDAFKARVADREQIGEILLALRPKAPAFLLRSRLPEILELFPNDERLAELVRSLESTLDGEEDAREAALSDARAHLSDTYRLHRRLLRNRRAAIAATTYSVRGRSGLKVLDDGDARRAAVDDWLERWRLTLLEDAREADDAAALREAAEAFLVYFQCSTGDLEALRGAAEFKRTWKRPTREAAGIAPDEGARVRAFPISERQRTVLAELDDILGDPPEALTRGRAIVNTLLELREDVIVVFASSPATAAAVAYQLEAAGEAVGLYTAGKSDEGRRSAAVAFTDGVRRRFLVCDRTGEEGVNLQVADCIVHVDLPLSTTRIEQRIGRADRHGAPSPVRNYVVAPGPPGGAGEWWLNLLDEGFEVFETTTARMQYAIETVERDLLLAAAMEGPDEAARVSASLKDRVRDEQERIDRLDSLDALARQDTDDVQFVDAVRAVETAGAGEFSVAVLQALNSVHSDLGAVSSRRERGGRDLRLSKSPPALRIYDGVRDRELAISAERALAVEDPEVSLLRPGAPLVEAIRMHLDWDDRSQTATVWATDRSLPESLLGIRCDVVIRADPGPAFATWNELEKARPRTGGAHRTDADAPLAIGALHRRLDAYLPPRARTLWVDEHGAPVMDERSLQVLESAYETATDEAWTPTRWSQVARHCGVLSMDDVLLPVGELVERHLLTEQPIRDEAESASARARAHWGETERALRLRAELGLGSVAAERDLEAERAVGRLLLAALAEPVVQWSAAAVVFVEAGDRA